MKQQTAYYDKEIEILSQKIVDAENINIIHQEQIDVIQRYIAEINKIMDFDSENELLYQEILDRIAIFPGNLAIVYLNCVPFGEKLQYHSFGRREKYSVLIDKMEVVNAR